MLSMLPTDDEINHTADRDTAEERRMERRAQEEEAFKELNKLRRRIEAERTFGYKSTVEQRNATASF
jgi:hypothetical protein